MTSPTSPPAILVLCALLILTGCAPQKAPQFVRVQPTEFRVAKCGFDPAMTLRPAMPLYGYSEGHWMDAAQAMDCEWSDKTGAFDVYECIMIICRP